MDKLIVEPKDAAEYESLTNFLKEKGIGYTTEEEQEQEKKRAARRKLVNFINEVPKYDIEMEEITEWVEKVRSETYAARHSNHS